MYTLELENSLHNMFFFDFIYPTLYNTQVILAFWLVFAYDLLEDRHIDDDSAWFKFFFKFKFEPITILC